MRPSRPRRLRAVAPLALVGALAACDLPSEAPILQQTWVVPGDSVTVGVSQFLPADIALTGGGTAFLVAVPAPGAFSATLAALCGQPACQSGTAVTAPVPAFSSDSADLTRTVAFPATVASATVTAGQLNLSVNNQLGFDPLRPNGNTAPFGSIAIRISNGNTTSTTTLQGNTQAMPTGATTVLAVPLATGAYAGGFTVSVTFDVPAGATATFSGSSAITITPSITGLTVSNAVVVVDNEPISTTPTLYDLDDVDFADQVESGGLLLDIQNPFTVAAATTFSIQAPAQNGAPAVLIAKAVDIPSIATATVPVTLTQAELQSLVGKSNVTIAVSGNASGTGFGKTMGVSPTQRMVLRTRLQLVLNVGG